MGRNPKTLTIADIQTSDILYYDPKLNDQCYSFCEDRNIDCLPALDDGLYHTDEKRMIFIRDDKGKTFNKEIIGTDRVVHGTINIFHPKMLDRLSVQPLLLVHQDDELSGVVHFADYGKPVVSIYLYELFLDYEKALRQLLSDQNLGNDDMLAYFEWKNDEFNNKRLKKYRSRIEAEKRPPFEHFSLRELIALCNHKKLGKLNDDIGNLRNSIMHANELVSREDPHADDYIYNFASFEKFFTLAIKFHLDYRRVTNWIAFNTNNN